MSATVTQSQNLANLRTASRNVATEQGVDPDNLSYDERVTFNKGLAEEILKYPQSFTDQTLATATAITAKSYASLQDTDISWSDFGNAAIDEAGNIVAGLPSFLSPLLMVAIVAALAFYVLPGAIAKARASAPAA